MADIQHMSEARDIAEREVARTLRREKIKKHMFFRDKKKEKFQPINHRQGRIYR